MDLKNEELEAIVITGMERQIRNIIHEDFWVKVYNTIEEGGGAIRYGNVEKVSIEYQSKAFRAIKQDIFKFEAPLYCPAYHPDHTLGLAHIHFRFTLVSRAILGTFLFELLPSLGRSKTV